MSQKWFTKEDAVRIASLNSTDQQRLRRLGKIKLMKNPFETISRKEGYSARAFLKLLDLAGFDVLQMSGKTMFVKKAKVFPGEMFEADEVKNALNFVAVQDTVRTS